MKNVTKLTLGTLFGFIILTTTVDAGIINKGQKIYSTKIKGQCGDKTAEAFSTTFNQKEWEDAFKAGTFEAKVKEVCPTVETYKEQWTPYLFEFTYEYAKDTGNKPAC